MNYNRIKFEKFTLDNGLRVVLHQDCSSQLVTTNLLYNVGAKDEDPNCTGLAHLFEHLMFSGTKKYQILILFWKKLEHKTMRLQIMIYKLLYYSSTQ